MSALKFSLKGTSVPVAIENTQGAVEDYELREMTAAVRDQYLDTLGERLKVGPDGRPAGVKKFDGMQADLISRCLFSKGSGRAVDAKILQTWPGSVITDLFAEAQKLNKLNVVAEEETKPKNG